VQGSESSQGSTVVLVQEATGVPAQGTQTTELSQVSTITSSFSVQGSESSQDSTVVLVQEGIGVPAQGTQTTELSQVSTIS
jgi:hypothetical protein